ncbi:Atg8 deconjugator Atg4 [Schizosaccharomyces japonicus yFS275]|uniref:Cysteine protease n=1 Tax=Schizosaccharomyces japonicus (strain yFS275 / FY16936) TaxID=402676 RepID=B6K091_SCHJY|nr:Atg8 deconjugator Atg4 [Schizosaccharomyces japonicus yFS275]EEB06241.1 Atg8 deconjugator Atg4 [Schizosaccharomyces japonicus yFS275]
MELMSHILERYLRMFPTNHEPSGTFIWSLGHSYATETGKWPEAFVQDTYDLLSLTYRKCIAGMECFSSDAGWGCMIRSMQTMLANCLRRVQPSLPVHKILHYFADEANAYLSLHQFVDAGHTLCNITPGNWFGPATVSHCAAHLCSTHPQVGLNVCVSHDGAIMYRDQLRNTPYPRLLLFTLRLGIDTIHTSYYEQLCHVLTIPQAIGIVGGRPRAAHYFYACQSQWFFYLDPHTTQTAHTFDNPAPNSSFHVTTLRRLRINELDPCMVLGFAITSEECQTDFEQRIVKLDKLVHIADTMPDNDSVDEDSVWEF